jgi:hypothetical protein
MRGAKTYQEYGHMQDAGMIVRELDRHADFVFEYSQRREKLSHQMWLRVIY